MFPFLKCLNVRTERQYVYSLQHEKKGVFKAQEGKNWVGAPNPLKFTAFLHFNLV